MMLEKKIIFFNEIINRREATFWGDIIKLAIAYDVDEEKSNRLSKIISEYKSICDILEKIWDVKRGVLRADVSKYRPEVYKSEKSKILKKIHKVALGTLLT